MTGEIIEACSPEAVEWYKKSPRFIRFPSIKEARRYGELRQAETHGLISDLERQVPYPLVVGGKKICKIVWDFRYKEHDGQILIEDTKGYKTKEFQIKFRLFQALYPTQVVILS